jgi:hypothetical protein
LRPHTTSPSNSHRTSSSLLSPEASPPAAAISSSFALREDAKARRGDLSIKDYLTTPITSDDDPDPWPTPIKKPGYCTNYGTCDDTTTQRIVNCRNNSQAIKPNFDITAICPQYTEAACCDSVQYNILLTQVCHTSLRSMYEL